MGSSMTEESGQASSNGSSFVHRKVEFHLARKPTSYLHASSSDFKLETLAPSTSTTTSITDPHSQYLASNSSLDSSMKSGSSNFIDYGFGPEFNHRFTVRRIGAGLENLGNTCFLNSVLQCLTYTEPLAAYLQSGKHQTSCRIAGFCALCAIQKHVSRALQSSGRSLAPKDLVSNLRCISRSFRNARQEDAHEYMIQLLEAMHKCCLPSGVPTESPSAYDKSLVHKIFGGRLRSQVKCMQCSYCSNKFDPFLDLSLEIMKADSLYKALLHFTAAEQLDGGQRQYNCEKCKKKVKALKQLTVHKAPYVLSIHLKRFGSHVTGQKIDKKVQFGPAMDLKPFVSGPYDGDLKYTLYGVLVHAGWSTHSGHYYCFVRTSNGMWYSLDDNRVYQVSEKSVLNQKAYMLFYVRDRSNLPLKKPIDVIQKGSMFEATVQNNFFPATEDHSNGTQRNTNAKSLRESDQDGSISKQSNGDDTHDLPAQQNGPIVNSRGDARPKEESVQYNGGIILSECSFHKDKTVVLKSDAQAGTPAIKCSDERPNGTQSMTATSTGSKEEKCSESDLLTSEAKLSGVDRHANIVDDASLTPLASKLDHAAAANVRNGSYPDHNNTVSMNIDRNQSSCQKLNGAPLVGYNHMPEKSHSKASNQPTDGETGRQANTTAKVGSGYLAQVKLKKKKKQQLFMCKGASMHLSKNILYGTFLSQQKRKKLKRTKQHALNIHPKLKEHCISEDVVPYDSDRLTSSSDGSYKHSHKIGRKSGLRKRDVAAAPDNLIKGTVGRQKKNFRLEIPDMQCQNNSCSLLSGEQLDVQKPGVSKACLNEVHTSDISSLTMVLDDTNVGHWEGVELPPGITESKGFGDFHIGHIGDEWDEEYDRGKRKKVRQSTIGFGGSNPFQEIAMKKAKLKR